MSRFFAVAASAVVVAGLGATLWVIQMNTSRSFADCSGSEVAGGDLGGPFTLVDENGRTVTDADIVTEPTLIYFGYTFCPDVCPLDVMRNAQAIDILDEQGVSVTPVFISIDPARDTPEVVADFTDNFHDRMIGLTGSEEQVAAASRAYRTFYQKSGDDPEYYLMDHTTFSYLTLPEIGFVEFFRQTASPEEMAETIACYAAAA
ncbi:SCO family protein [Yoonia sp. 208BN28-4]|uniref:SCO family protein n=1 Tax=Yoonia sp. 208BN28-4 TaxID=3126505 RepID=UPI003094E3F9